MKTMASLISLIIILVCSGCGGVSAACQDFTPSEIDTLITFAEADRRNGYTKEQELQALLYGCNYPSCLVCGTAIVNLVYGE